MLQLIFSILALFVGVALCASIQKRPSWLSFFDAFVVVSIVGLVLFHIVPHCLEDSGILGMATIAIGFGIPALVHQRSHRHEHDANCSGEHDDEKKSKFAQYAMMAAIVVGMCAHTILDGIGLSMSDMGDDVGAAGNLLSISVLFHRLPVGVFLSLMLVPRIGTRKTWAIAATMALSTVLGYGLGHFALPHLGMTILNLVQGLIAGMLLHVVFHNVSVGGAREFRYAKGIGALLGIAAFAFMTWIVPVHAHQHASPLDLWIGLFYDAAPIWALFAAILALGYGLKRHKNEKIALLGNHICQYLDPQQRPVAAGGAPHIFCATGFAAIFALFDTCFAATWWIAVAAAVILSYLLLPVRVECSMCERIGHCDTEKSFASWTMTSFGTLAGILLIASIIPFFVAPLTESLAHLSPLATSAILTTFSIVYLGFHGYMAMRRHGTHTDFIGYHAHIIIMFSILCVFNFGEFGFHRLLFVALIAAYGIAFLSYSESPLAIPSDQQRQAKSSIKFAAALTVALALFVAIGLQTHDENRAAFIEAIAPDVASAMIHHEHELDSHHEHIPELDSHHEHIPELDSHHEHIPELDSHHEHIPELDSHHEHIPELEPEHGLSSIFLPHVAWDVFHLALFVVFMLTGLYWVFRVGPRDLFRAKSKHHHHDVEA